MDLFHLLRNNFQAVLPTGFLDFGVLTEKGVELDNILCEWRCAAQFSVKIVAMNGELSHPRSRRKILRI
jgi:hypothetical protein